MSDDSPSLDAAPPATSQTGAGAAARAFRGAQQRSARRRRRASLANGAALTPAPTSAQNDAPTNSDSPLPQAAPSSSSGPPASTGPVSAQALATTRPSSHDPAA
ncbi:MAG TPA: hypothetical protein ENK23_09145, partial [Sorangium sp.]|nr:hypothetical protein [Sorangium sp.]